MRTLGNAATFAGLWLAAGCNALFGVEDPVIVEPAASGGEAGERTAGASGGGPIISPQRPAPGGAGGAGGAPFDPEAGAGGLSEIPEAGGGAGGEIEQGPGTGGTAPAQGGTQSTTGGVADAGSDNSPAGAAGAAGASGCAEGESHCAPDNLTLETCDGGTPGSVLCPNGCIQGACAECIPRTVECRTADNSVRVCGDDGRFDDFEECDDEETCLPGEGCGGKCGPDQVRCNTMTGDAEACDRGEWSLVRECTTNDELCVVESGVSKCIENKVRPLGPETPLTNGSLRSVTPDVLHIYPAPLVDVKAFAIQLGLIGAGQPAYARLVLYADDGNGYPGARLRVTDVLTVAATEANARDLPGAPLLLDPDLRYWIGVVFASSGSPQLYCRTNQPQEPGGYLVSQPYDDGFPDTFPPGALPDAGTVCNLFLRVRTQTP
jgi:hypothetical protein